MYFFLQGFFPNDEANSTPRAPMLRKGNRIMRHLRSRASLSALLSAAALFAGSAVKADIIPVFNAVTPSGSNSEFSYSVSIPDGSRVNTGDYFTIYDFAGYVAGTEFAPAGWTTSVQLVGITPPTQGVADNPGVENITFTYTGIPTIFGPSFPEGGVGAFGAESTFGTENPGGTYAAHSHKSNPGKADDDTVQENNGHLVVPAAVPEASSLMLLATGLVPLGIMLRRKVAKS
jgi:hypothetical protein